MFVMSGHGMVPHHHALGISLLLIERASIQSVIYWTTKAGCMRNKELRTREYLTPNKFEKLLEAGLRSSN